MDISPEQEAEMLAAAAAEMARADFEHWWESHYVPSGNQEADLRQAYLAGHSQATHNQKMGYGK